MSAFSARKPPAPSTKPDFTAGSLNIVEFLEKNGVSEQASAGMVGSLAQELMVTAQIACVRTVLPQGRRAARQSKAI